MNKRLFSGHFAGAVLRIAACAIPTAMIGMAEAAEVVANFTSATTIPVTAASYTATGNTVNLALGFAPPLGTDLTIVNNTGLNLIQGTFDNLAQGQRVTLAFDGINYPFVASYFGGTGNDLVLEWGNTRAMSWGYNGTGGLGAKIWETQSTTPIPVAAAGNLDGRAVSISAGPIHSLSLAPEGAVYAWGSNASLQLGIGITTNQFSPVALSLAGDGPGKHVVALATGYSHSLALREDGTLLAWGNSSSGQMGTGTNPNNSYPDSPPVSVNMTGILSGRKVLAIAAGNSHNLALCEGGVVASWGYNSYGQVGDNSTSNRFLPVWVNGTGILAGKSVVAIAGGNNHSLALCSDGTLAAWGENFYGRLGDGTTTNRKTPVQVIQNGVLAGKTVRRIAGGGEHSLILCSDGTLAAWGANSYGQLGDGTTTGRNAPVLVNRTGVLAGKTVVAIAAGNYSSLALCSDGSIAAWGVGSSGQLGNSTTTYSATLPVLVQSDTVAAGGKPIKISMRGSHALALVAIPPPPIAETGSVTDIGNSTAKLHGMVNANGTATNVRFEYGQTTTFGRSVAAVPTTADGTAMTAVSVTLSDLAFGTTYHYRMVAEGAGGTVYGSTGSFTTTDTVALAELACGSGALVPAFDSSQTSYAVAVPSDVSETTVTPAALHPDATVKVNGVTVESGAASPAIPLASGDNTVTVEVVAANGSTQIYRIVATRLPETFLLESASVAPVTVAGISAAGIRVDLALGFAPPVGATLPVITNTGMLPIQGGFSNLAPNQTISLVYQGVKYTWMANYRGGDGNDLVLEWANRRVVAWGDGNLGDGSTTSSTVPIAVDDGLLAGRFMAAVDSGGGSDMVVCSDGTLAVWGGRSSGGLGDGTQQARKIPVNIAGMGDLAGRTVIAAADGSEHGMALCADGVLVGWGYNSSGQIGNNGTWAADLPSRTDQSGVLAGKSIKSLVCGGYHTLALCTDGTLAAWGANSEGQLGFRNPSLYANTWLQPTLTGKSGVLADKTITAIAAGGYFSMALCTDGTLAMWGNVSSANVGTGDRPDYAVAWPANYSGVLVGKTITAISACSSYALALCSDGTLAEFQGSRIPTLVNRSGVLAGKTVTSIACGYQKHSVVCSDGSLATWSAYAGSVTDPPILVTGGALASGERFVTAASGTTHILAITARPPQPMVQTLPAESVTDNSAVLRGEASPNGVTTAVAIEFGLTTSYGTTVAVVPASISGTTPAVVTAAIANLIPNTTYHYRVIGQSAGGVAKGEDAAFTTTDLATLSSLAPGAGTLQSAFDPKRLTYGMTVPYASTGVAFTPVTTYADATVRVNGVVVASGAASQEMPLTVGNSVVNVAVTGASGQTLTYQVAVTRMPEVFAFAAATTVPVAADAFQAVGDATFALNFTPAPGAVLTAVNVTGRTAISGRFANLRQWQMVNLSYGGVAYQFVADYFGGTGNDLVLRWAHQRLLAWGYNGTGQLGDGTAMNRLTPVASGLEGRTVVATATGQTHSLALRSDGVLFAWGENQYGQLGTGGKMASSVPVAVDTGGEMAGRTILSLGADQLNSFALCEDGSLFAWGGSYGLLPARVALDGALAGKSITMVAVGGSHRLALCTDGTLAAWGGNDYGQLGDGTLTTRAAPVLVSRSGALAGKDVIAIAAGDRHSLVLCADGTLAAWGDGFDGQVGTTESASGWFSRYLVPAVVSRGGVLADKTIKALASGGTHNLVLCGDGTLASWGAGSSGQLGNNSTSKSSAPVLVSTSGVLAGKTVSAIAAGGGSCMALCTDGTLAAWGNNYSGQLGDGTTATRTTPVRVLNGALGTGQSFSALGGLRFHALVIAAMTPPPVAETLAATGFGDTTATVNGRVNGAGSSTTVSFEYGLTTDYGSTVAGVPATVSGSTSTTVSAALANLMPDTVYHYRVVASGSGGVVKGADHVLTTTDVAKLVSLTVDGAAALSPAFASGIMRYETTVANAIASVTVTPVAAVADAVIKVNGSMVASGSASGPLALAAGSNIITVEVTAAGQMRSYEVVVTRLPAVMEFPSAATVPVTAAGFSLSSLPVQLSLGFAPPVGTRLMVLKNTGTGLIQGTFANLAQWQVVNLTYNNIQYPFVANYFGGTGNDLMLEWAGQRLLSWGRNSDGRLGDGTTVDRTVPSAVADGALAGKWIVRSVAGGTHNLALGADGTLAAWGANASGQLGTGEVQDRYVPTRVDMSGVLAGKLPVALAAGDRHNLVLCSDGTLVAWGGNDKGQLGDGTTTNRTVPVRVDQAGALAGKPVVAIACGSNHSLVWCGDGTLVAWGDNASGQLGDGSLVNRSTPVRVHQAGVLSNKNIAAIASGGYFNLVLCADGSLAAWGDNPYGQLGNGSVVDASTPVLVDRGGVLAGKTVTAIACGGAHCLALCSDGILASWGGSWAGQLGDGTIYDSTGKWVPVLVTRTGVLSGKTVVGIAGCDSHSLALCSDGTLTAWGTNLNGELGNNSTTSTGTPVLVSAAALRTGERYVTFGGGTYHSLAAVAQPVPPVVETLAAANLKDTSATLNGRVNGNGTTTAVSFEYGFTTAYGSTVTATPASVSGTTATAVSTAPSGLLPGKVYHFRCVGTQAGRSVYGGDQTFTTTSFASLAGLTPGVGVLLPSFDPGITRYDVTLAAAEISLTPVTLDPAATVAINGTAVASGTASPAIALNPGSNTINVVVSGAGGNTRTYQVIATRLPATLTFASAATVPAAAGGFAVNDLTVNFALGYAPLAGTRLMVLNNTGNLPIQGRFSNLAQGQVLQLAFGGVEYRFVANYLGGDGNDLVLDWGYFRLVGWGYNDYGGLGDGTSTSRSVPVPVGNAVLTDKLVTRIVTGGGHSLALCADGTLVAWGGNYYGQYGNGSNSNSYTPVIVPRGGALAGQGITGLWAGLLHSVALLEDGTLAAWGYNQSAQLGDGTTTNRNVPVPVTMDGVLAGKTVKAVSCGSSHTLVLCTDGSLAAWGSNGLGNRGTDWSPVPVAVDRSGVLAGKTVTAIAAGDRFSLAACADGTVAAWGANDFGQLGNGGTSGSTLPVLVTRTGVLAGKTVTALAAGEGFSLALCADGTMAAWGSNFDGQLGNGSATSDSTVPVLVTRTGVLAGKTVTTLSAGKSHALAFCADGTVAAWGNNDYGQLGDNSTTNRTAPVLVKTSGLASGERFSAAQAGDARSGALVGMPPPPGVTTLAASNITATGATLKGMVNAAGGSAAVTFEYGTTTSYGTTATASPSPAAGFSSVAVACPISGLTSGTLYHYRVVATNAGGTTYGADMTFIPSGPPVFSGYTAATPYQTPAAIALRKLLTKAFDPDGDSISITSAGPASANGGAVALLADAVRYTPPNGFSGTDTFTIVLTDTGGASTTGTVTVQVGSAPNAGTPAANANPPKLTTLPGGKMGIAFQGIPGRSYIVQRSAGGLDDWQTLATVTADAAGKISYTDENPPPGSAFYRLGIP